LPGAALIAAASAIEPREHGLRSHCGGSHYQSDVQPWLGWCEQQIRKAGFTESTFKGRKLEIRIDSNTGCLNISKSSGSSMVDRAAIGLLVSASPFEVPPIGIPRSRPIFAEFDYPQLELKFQPLPWEDSWRRDPYVPESARSAIVRQR